MFKLFLDMTISKIRRDVNPARLHSILLEFELSNLFFFFFLFFTVPQVPLVNLLQKKIKKLYLRTFWKYGLQNNKKGLKNKAQYDNC